MSPEDKPLVWLRDGVKTPPLSRAARINAGFLLRQLQQGKQLAMPHSRPMPVIGARCHELRIADEGATWRIIYRTDADAVVILEIFGKKTRETPKSVIKACRKRMKDYDNA
jgi:phage-related protein